MFVELLKFKLNLNNNYLTQAAEWSQHYQTIKIKNEIEKQKISSDTLQNRVIDDASNRIICNEIIKQKNM